MEHFFNSYSWFNIYNIVVIAWYAISFFVMLYIYEKCIKRYTSANEKKKYEKNPTKITISELSYLMYKKINPEVLTATILNLIEKGYLYVEEIESEYYLYEKSGNIEKLSQSEKYVINMLNRIIDGKKSISVTNLSKICNNKKDAVDFLINYDVYLKLLRNESTNEPYFETKVIYNMISKYKAISFILWIISLIFTIYKNYSIWGYCLIIISYFINELFLNSYKRTKKANDLYFDYLAYKNYLEDIDKLGYDNNNINEYITNGLILKAKDIHLKLNQSDFSIKLNKAINRCIKKANDRR